MIVALDAEAFNALAGPDSIRKQKVRRILRRARLLGRDAFVPSLVLARCSPSSTAVGAEINWSMPAWHASVVR